MVSHHLPSKHSQDPQYADSLIGPSFYSTDLEDIVGQERIVLWVHGHTHSSMDYMHGRTRVVCNPRGYCNMWRDRVKKRENLHFDEDMVVSIEATIPSLSSATP